MYPSSNSGVKCVAPVAGTTRVQGEHAAILRGCRKKGWKRAGYTLPTHEVFHAYMDELRTYLGPNWSPLRIAKDGCGLPTVSNTVLGIGTNLRRSGSGQRQDWIWEAMVRHPDLVGGFNRLDSTILKAGNGHVIAKEGADGLLGMAIEHPDYPKRTGHRGEDRPQVEFPSNMVRCSSVAGCARN